MQGVPSLHLIDSPCTSSAFVDLEDGAFSHTDLDVLTPYGNYDNCLASDLVEPPFNQTNNNFTEEDQDDLAYQGAYNN
jgi:hypothetical protein